MERVLVTGGANIGKAGVGTIVYKWGQAFDAELLVYDYLMQRSLPDKTFQEAISAKGGIIYTMPGKSHSFVDIMYWVSHIIRENNYKRLHINTDTAYIAAAYIFAAKRSGIERIFVHSHCTQVDDTNKLKRKIKTILHYIFKPYVRNNTKMYLACSELAGIWMFGKKCVKSNKYKTIYNGVEAGVYLFDVDVRRKYRNEFGLTDYFVIGNIGRLSYQKNQEFLLDVFTLYQSNNSNSRLVLIGAGPLKQVLQKKIIEVGLQDKVIMLENRNDIPALLSMMDIMVMPSRFEGLPVTMVEAQMNSLPCIVSEAITREAKFTDIVTYVNGWDEDNWIKAIDDIKKKDRENLKENLINSRFNITFAARQLQNILLL